MNELEIGGDSLGRIHKVNNDKKYFCHFTGFIEGIVASGNLEHGEIEPLLAECEQFAKISDDDDAYEVLEDFKAQVFEFSSLEDAIEYRIKEIDGTSEKSALNRFLGFCRGIFCDNLITLDEAEMLLSKIDDSPQLRTHIGIKQIEICCIDAVCDGIIDPMESAEICEAISQIVGDSYADTGVSQADGVANYNEFIISDLKDDFEGRKIVLTGSFKDKPRSKFENKLSDLGAIMVRTVTKDTDYVLIGGEASRDWIEMNRGTKIKKAQALHMKFGKPHFISEWQVLSKLM